LLKSSQSVYTFGTKQISTKITAKTHKKRLIMPNQKQKGDICLPIFELV